MKVANVHLVSTGTCETASQIKKAVFRQFKDVKTHTFIWPLVKNKKKIVEFAEALREKPGIVMFSITKRSLAEALLTEVRKVPNCTSLDVIWYSILRVSRFLKEEAISDIDCKYSFDDEYYNKIEAINFTNKHDDGRKIDDIHEADIVILGPSRTSKTPTSIFISEKGYKVLNIPLSTNMTLPIDDLKNHKCVFGFKIDSERLRSVRKQRKISTELNEKYVNIEEINKEIKFCLNLYKKINCFTIDVTSRSIEETSAIIINTYQKFL